MAMQVSIKGLNGLRKAMKDAGSNIADMRTPYKQSAVFLDRWVQQNFKTEGGNIGGWRPFARGGRMRRGKLDTSAKLLQDTGRLRVSFKSWATDTNAGIGSDLEYSKYHNEGIGAPERRILPKREEIRKDILKIFNQHTAKQLRRTFGVK